MDYLIRFSTQHESFRLAEVEALTTLLNEKLRRHNVTGRRFEEVQVDVIEYSPSSPFCVLRFSQPNRESDNESEADQTHLEYFASQFISKSIEAKAIYELWGHGHDYASLHAGVRSRSKRLWSRYEHNVSFKFSVDTYGGKRSSSEQREIINQFAYLGFKGKIEMKNPDREWSVMEEWSGMAISGMVASPEQADDVAQASPVQDAITPRVLRHVFLARLIAPSRRHLIEKHDLKKRPYISTTSMDAELALITANLALASPGKLFLDPFCGTGGFMVAAAELGATVLGCDIDGRSFRGKGEGLEKGVIKNFRKYGLEGLFGNCITSDLTNSPLRLVGRRWLDGIIADIPYGIREGLKVLGRRQPLEEGRVPSKPHLIDGVPAFTLPGYIAPKRPYSFNRLLDDILDFAARTLVDGGRLAFWMPTANENEQGDEQETAVPGHSSLELKHQCIQRFNKWSRRLLVYERVSGEVEAGLTESLRKLSVNGTNADDLNDFRRRYFQAFESKASSQE